MTKWKRLRKLREKKRFEAEVLRPKAEGEEVKQTEPEKISKNIQQSQEIEKLGSTKTSNNYNSCSNSPLCLPASNFCVTFRRFFPANNTPMPFDYVIQGTAILFLGLAGGILLFKATTSDNRRGILIAIGFALITICLVLIYHIQDAFSSLYF